jgi:phosphonate transport system substrate-binding protein
MLNRSLNILKGLIFFTLFFSASVAAQSDSKALVFGVHPYLHSTLLIERFTPLVNNLSAAMGREIKIRVGTSYQEHIDAFKNGQVDFAYFGPASFVQLTSNGKHYRPLGRLSFSGYNTFHGAIVVRKDSDIKTVAELAGKSFAFGDPNSTLSNLVPRHMLLDAGVDLKDLSSYATLKNHENVALAVLLGKYDAGGVKNEVFEEYESRGLRILQLTPEVPTHLFVAGNNLPEDLVQDISRLMQSLKGSTQGQEILQQIKKGTTEIIPAQTSEYEALRKLLSPRENTK